MHIGEHKDKTLHTLDQWLLIWEQSPSGTIWHISGSNELISYTLPTLLTLAICGDK
jgi:hypothetical protein